MPALTVVITTWNRADMVLNAIESVLAQDCQEPLEIVIVDDGSTDGTASVLSDLGRRPLPRNRHVRVARISHVGRTGSAQHGIDIASAPYVSLLSSDDVWEPQRARELLAEERRLGGNALLHTDWKEMDISGRLVRGERGTLPASRRVACNYCRASDGDGILHEYVTSVFQHYCFASCASMFPRDLLSGPYALDAGMSTPDLWVPLVGYLRCRVAYVDVSSLRRTVHVQQQHRLAEANLWPGLAAGQAVTADAIVRLLVQVTPGERSMIDVMRMRWRLLALRASCAEHRRLECLFGSLAAIPAAMAFPRLLTTVVSNVLLAASPVLHDAARHGWASRRLARALSGREESS